MAGSWRGRAGRAGKVGGRASLREAGGIAEVALPGPDDRASRAGEVAGGASADECRTACRPDRRRVLRAAGLRGRLRADPPRQAARRGHPDGDAATATGPTLILDQAQAVVDRTNEQLARTDSITASMDEVTANMAELSGNVSVLAGFARGLAGAVSAPVTGLAALGYGVRHAVSLRRPDAVPPLPADPRRAARGRAGVLQAARPADRPGPGRRCRRGAGGRADDPARVLDGGRGRDRGQRLPAGEPPGAHGRSRPGRAAR